MQKRIVSLLLAVLMLLSSIAVAFPVSAAHENTYVNTGNHRADIIGVAKTQIGYKEGSNNDTKYGTWYGKPNQDWCAMFVSWCARQANIPTSILKNSAAAGHSAAFFNIPYYDGSVYTPSPGDLFFTKSWSHVGLVYYLDGSYFYTIEGNYKDQVYVERRKISDHYFGVPNYNSGGSTINYYTVSYDANGGVGAPSAQTAEGCSTINLQAQYPSRTGYTFKGWSTSPTATLATYAPNGTFLVNSNTTLYAVWEKNSYPTKPVVISNKTNYATGETIVFSWAYDSNVTSYWVHLYDENMQLLYNEPVGTATNFLYHFNTPGKYSICVQARNDVGYADSTLISVNVLKNQATLKYTYNDDGTATVAGFESEGTAVDIPRTVFNDGKTYLVTKIAPIAFDGCSFIQSVTFPDSITEINYYSFRNCTSLMNIVLPDTVIFIGYDAFYNTAYYNNSSNWENGLLYINNHLIAAKTTINGAVTVKNGCKTIAGGAFNHCTSITSISMPNSVVNIGSYAFEGCTALTNVAISNSISNIGAYTFYGCKSLASINIPNSVTTIGTFAFYDCAGLTSITIPDGVSSIDNKAFMSCTALKDIVIADSVISIGYDVFTNTAHYNNSSNWENGMLYINNQLIEAESTVSGDVIIKPECKTIAGGAFYDCPLITSVTIPSGIINIGEFAFEYCTALENIIIPGSITNVGVYAFYGCNALKDVYYSGAESQWNSIAVDSYNEPLTNANIHFDPCLYGHTTKSVVTKPTCTEQGYTTHVCEICGETYNDTYTNPTGHTAGEWVVVKEASAESNGLKELHCQICDAVIDSEEIIFQDGVSWTFDEQTGTLTISGKGEIEDYANETGQPWYQHRAEIKKIIINNGVTSIGAQAFFDYDMLESVSIADSVTSIGNSAFYFCDSLVSVDISAYVTEIGNYAFHYCNKLTDINVDANNEVYSSLDGVLFNKNKTILIAFPSGKKVDSYTVPLGVEEIKKYSFLNTYAKNIVLQNGVKKIGEFAFYWTDCIQSIELPNTLVSIEKNAFDACRKIQNVYYVGTKTQWNGIAIAASNNYLLNANRSYVPCKYGHTAGEWVVVKEASAESNGLKELHCQICDAVIDSEEIIFQDGVSWTFDEQTGTLTISGKGEIEDYANETGQPWYQHRAEIKKVIINNGVTSIGAQAFFDYDMLESVSIADSVTSIGNSAFYFCDSLVSVDISAYVTEIGNYAFHYCNKLTDINVDANNEVYSSIDGVLFNKNKTILIAFPSGKKVDSYTVPLDVEEIRKYAFLNTYAKNIVLQNGVKKIGEFAFYWTSSIESVELPNTLEVIEKYAFEQCRSIKNVVYKGCKTQWSNIKIESNNTYMTSAKRTYLSVVNVSINTLPHKTVYECNETINTDGLSLNITFNDGSTAVVTNGFSISGFDSQTEGVKEITVTYEKVPTTFNVRIYSLTSGTECKPEISYISVTLKNDLTVNFKVDKQQFLSDGFENPYIVFEFNGKVKTVYDFTENDGKYVFSFDGIAPHKMCDVITATLYASKDGNQIVSDSVSFSVVEYCHQLLEQSDNSVYTLIVDMLNYGAQAQIYKSYKTDCLANSQLTDIQKNYATQTSPVYSTLINKIYPTVTNTSVKWLSAGLYLENSVAIKIKFNVADIQNISIKVIGENQEWNISEDEIVRKADGYYIYFDKLNASQMREKLQFLVYKNDELISSRLVYSIEDYGFTAHQNSMDDLVPLVDAMMRYGDSAKNFIN